MLCLHPAESRSTAGMQEFSGNHSPKAKTRSSTSAVLSALQRPNKVLGVFLFVFCAAPF